MAKILIKRSNSAGNAPTASDIDYGELAINYVDGKLYYKDNSNNIKAFLDSALVSEIVEGAINNQGEVQEIIDSNFANLASSIIPDVDSAVSLGSSTNRFKDLFLSGGTLVLGNLYIQDSDGGLVAHTDSANGPLASFGGQKFFDDIDEYVDSSFVQTLQSYNATTLAGQNPSYYQDYNNFTNTPTVLDSANVQALIDADVLDSAQVQNVVDSAYVQERVTKLFIDSLAVDAGTLDGQDGSFYSNYNNLSNRPSILDLTDVNTAIDNRVVQSFVNNLQINAETLAGQDSGYYLDYNNFSNTPTLIDSALTIQLIDSAYVQARQDFAYGSLTGTPITPLDSAQVTLIAQSVSIDSGTAMQLLLDSSEVVALIDSAYIQARQSSVGTGGLDSALVTQLIDSAYVQLRENNAEAGLDSATIIQLIDSAYVEARAPAGGTDSSTVVAIIDSHVTHTFINGLGPVDAETLNGESAGYYLDYGNLSNVPAAISKAVVDSLGVDAETLDDQDGTYYLNYSNFTNTPNVLDSSEILTSIIEPQVITRQVLGTEFIEFVHDSDVTVFNVEVATKTQAHRYHNTGSTNGYVIRNQESPFLQFVPGNTYRFDQSNGTNNGHPIRFYLDAGKNQEWTTGVTATGIAGNTGAYTEILVDSDTPSVLYYQCTAHGYMGNAVYSMTRNLSGDTTSNLPEGSNLYYTQSRVEGVVNTAYIQARQHLIDSDLTKALIDSAYVQLHQTPVKDSSFVTSIIDSAYVVARAPSGGGGGAVSVAFKTLSVAGEDDVVAETATDTLTFVAGNNMTITTDAATDTITLSSQQDSAAQGLTLSKFFFTSDSGQTVYGESADDVGSILAYLPNQNRINVYLNGILLVDSDDYTETDSSTITLDTPSTLGDILTVIKYGNDGAGGGSGTVDSASTIVLIGETVDSAYIAARQSVNIAGTLEINRFHYEADSGQTVFSGADKFSNTLTLTPANVEVYLNGILLELTTDYTVDSASVTLTEAADSGYSISIIETLGRVNQKSFLSQQIFEFDADSGQTIFTGLDRDSATLDLSTGTVDVFLNGILLSEENDYTFTNASLTLLSATDSGDFVAIVRKDGYLASATKLDVTSFDYNDLSGQTFSRSGFSYVPGTIAVYRNGTLQRSGPDYVATDGTSIVLQFSPDTNDLFQVHAFGATEIEAKVYDFLADSGQTDFSGLDKAGELLKYIPGEVIVFVNGIAINDSDDFTANDNVSIRLNTAAAAGDDIKIIGFSRQTTDGLRSIAAPFSLSKFEFTADSGQTAFSGSGLTYTATKANVYLNGLLLADEDFTATDGTTVTLTQAADSGDILIVETFVGNNIGIDSQGAKDAINSTYLATVIDSSYVQARVSSVNTNAKTWTERTTGVTIGANTRNIVDTTSNPITLTLPASPSLGDEVRIIDGVGNANTNNITLARNGSKILGADSDFIIDIDRAGVGFVYYDSAQGWIQIEA